MKTAIDITAGIRADRFAAIKYETLNGPGGIAVGKRLGLPWVLQWIFKKAWAHFCENIATVDWSKKQTAKSLFNDPDIWADMKHGIRQAFGRCLRYFVENGMLPLYVINPNSTGTKYYAPVGQ